MQPQLGLMPHTVIGGPYLPLTGGTLTGNLAINGNNTLSVGGALTGTTATFNGGTGAAATPLTVGSSSQTTYTLQQFQTSSHGTNGAYLIAYGAGHGSQAGNFAIKNTLSGKNIFFEVNTSRELTIENGASTFAGNVTLSDGALTVYESAATSPAISATSGWGGGVSNPIINFGRTGSAVAGSIGYDDPSTCLYIGTTTSHQLKFRTNNVDAITISASQNATFAGDVYATGSSNSNVVISRDNMYVDAGQLYIGADGATTDDTFRQRVTSGSYFIESRKSGTWTNRLQINSAGTLIASQGATFAGTISSSSISAEGMITVTQNDIGTGESVGLRIIRSGGAQIWNITSGITGVDNTTFNVRNSTSNTNVFSIDAGTNAATFAGTVSATNVGVNGFITHNGDSGTFMGWSANDTNVFYTAGNERLRIDANGNIGIGTDSPDAKLEVASGQAKTVTSGVEFARFGTSNEASNYATLTCEVKGAATAADRQWIFQTIESGVANAGRIVLQPSGGDVEIGGPIVTDPVNRGYTVGVNGSIQTSSFRIFSTNPQLGVFELQDDGNHAASNGSGSSLMTIEGNTPYATGTPWPLVAAVTTFAGSGSPGSGYLNSVWKFSGSNDGSKGHRAKVTIDYGLGIGYLSKSVGDIASDAALQIVDGLYNGGGTLSQIFYVAKGSTPRVGIGTDSPGANLDIVGATNTSTSSLLRVRTTDNPNALEKVVGFYVNTNTERGFISVNQYQTTYSTSSDYRLKENIVPISNSVERLKELKPYRFNFINGDPEYIVDGFIAHEAAEVIPEAVTGEKDAVDEDNNPSYQGIDQSKLVPLLTAALQEAISKIEQLEARVKELENK